MKVLYLTNNPQLAGTARILQSWVTLGEKSGVGACVAVQRPGTLLDWLNQRGTPARVSPMRWPTRLNPTPALLDAWTVARWARRQGVDIIHSNEHDVYPFAVLVRLFLRVPAVCHVRFVLARGFATWAFQGWRAPNALLWTTNQQRLDSAAAIAGVVPDDRQHLVRLGADPSVFHPAGDERSRRRRALGLEDDQIALGMTGAMRPIKRVDDFIDLAESVGESDRRVVGLIAGGPVSGEEAYAEHIRRRVAASPLGSRLRLLNHVELVAPFLQALDVFVGTSEYETFGNSVCEAMACRVPVAAYVGGSVAEVIGDAGAVVPTGDVRSLTQATLAYVQNEAGRRAAADRAYERARTQFSPAASYELLLAIYRAISHAAR